jgi:hypothetical protein
METTDTEKAAGARSSGARADTKEAAAPVSFFPPTDVWAPC